MARLVAERERDRDKQTRKREIERDRGRGSGSDGLKPKMPKKQWTIVTIQVHAWTAKYQSLM